MATTITSNNSVYGSGVALTQMNSDTITIDPVGYLISTTNHALLLNGSNASYTVTIAGMLMSNGAASRAGLYYSGGADLDLTVEQSGTIHGRMFGAVIDGFADIANYGTISSNGSAALLNTYSGNYYIDNFGLIASGLSHAVSLTGSGVHTINNSGVMRAGTAVSSMAVKSTHTAAADTVGNFGWIYGNVSLGGGNDKYLGASGRLFGDVLLGDGHDTATGGIDQDNFQGGAGNDTLTGNGGWDELLGEAGVDKLFGGAEGDLLYGGTQNDQLTGGAGGDELTGGANGDRFIFTSVTESRPEGGRDFIYDFSHAQGDKIQLTAIDANTKLAGNQAFTFIGTAAFSGVAGQLRYEKKSGNSYIQADINGDGQIDMEIVSDLAASFVKGDFIL